MESAGGGRTVHLAWQDQTVDEKTEGQLRVIRKVITVMQAADISAWLFGGDSMRGSAGSRASTATWSSGLSAFTPSDRRQCSLELAPRL
jgi:hypothetical protein